MIRRQSTKATWALVLALAVAVLGGDTLGAGTIPVQAARPHLFNIYTWHLQNFPVRWPHTLQQRLAGNEPSTSPKAVAEYFQLVQDVRDIQSRLERVAVKIGAGLEREAAELGLLQAAQKRDRLKDAVERGIEDLMSKMLIEQGFTSRVGFTDLLWPPVYFRLSDMPRVLVVSPRDRVQVLETHLLAPDMTLAEIEALERTIDSRGLSSLVESIGGVATYPSMVPDTSDLPLVLEEASHEWTHQYLFFHPLGQAYWDNPEMTTVNETVADLTGRELGIVLHQRFFAGELASPSQGASPGGTGGKMAALPPSFDFNATLRETRLTADKLLVEGKYDEAESYMEQQRAMLAENGYFIRKLNQAYFAFHGNYAERPGSVSPIGKYVRAIRKDSPGLQAFLRRAAGYTTLADLVRDYESIQKPL